VEYEDGVPSVARRLKAEMEPHSDPDTALARNPDWFAVRCLNGEWLFGHGINSHGFAPGGGTLVLKDSRGRIRVFFGHVCGTNAGLEWHAGNRGFKSIDSFYDMLTDIHRSLREWVSE
jgi:hypothetical protein